MDSSAETDRKDTVPQDYAAQAVHLVRTSQQINVQLSQMADQKANMLMGATFLVFTIAIGQARSGEFSLSLSVLAFFAFLSALFAVLAVLPSTGVRPHPTSNILFFGVFSQMTEEEYIQKVLASLHDDESFFRMMLRDTYQNGVVLQRKKYRFLGYAYRIFLAGLTLTFVIFVLEHFAIGTM